MPAASTEEPSSLWRRPWLAAFVVLAALSVLPLCATRYLPFCDLNGAEGLLGAWSKAGDPAARIDASFDINVRPLPNALYYAVGRLLVVFFSAPVASNIYLALFCILPLPLALHYTLRSFGKPASLALLAFAFVYHRCVWYGFLGSVTAVPLLVLSWGLANRAFVAPRWQKEHAWLAAVFLLLATAHGFLVLVGGALLVAWAVFACGGPVRGAMLRLLRNLAVVIPGLAYLGPWLGSAGERSGQGASFVEMLWSRSKPRAALGRTVEWFIDGYAGHLDEVVALVFAVGLLLLLIAGVRGSLSGGVLPGASLSGDTKGGDVVATSVAASGPARAPLLWRARLPFTALCLGAGYLLLPMSILKPVDWWAVHVRLLVPFVLALILLVPTRSRGLRPAWIVAPVSVAAGVYFLYMAVDFRSWYRNVETKGFDDVVAALPNAPQVLMLWPDFTAERHYAHFPMSHFGTLLLGEKGGRVSPVLGGLPKDMWVVAKPEPPGPGWGLARAFRWEPHARSWDFFFVKQPAPGNGIFPIAWPGPFPVEKVAESGLWSLWKKR